MRYLAVNNLNPSPLGYVGGSDVFTTLTPAAAQGIASAVDSSPRGAGRMLAIMHALDGALATVAPGATAFPWRRQSSLVQWYVETSGSPSAATNWLNTAHQAVQPVFGGRVRQLHRGKPAGVALLRFEPGPADRRSASRTSTAWTSVFNTWLNHSAVTSLTWVGIGRVAPGALVVTSPL